MNGFGDNPFDDGLDYIGCPPLPTQLSLPEFPDVFQKDCKLIRWGRCLRTPDGVRRMKLVIEDFGIDLARCSVYQGFVRFFDELTGDEWYNGKLKFYYTRNYPYTSTFFDGTLHKLIAFRFVIKGDLRRVSEEITDPKSLILCTNHELANERDVPSYEEIFVYGGLEILFDVKSKETVGILFSLGHNDGWYTHHPKCSARPIDWHGAGDLIGHYCERGWLFVSPGRNFIFSPRIAPPTGRFFKEALRKLENHCYTEEAIRYGELEPEADRCIHSYQTLTGITACKTPFASVEFCQGMVYTGSKHPWITFFAMGYWLDHLQKKRHVLHLVEGNIKLGRQDREEYRKGLYFYGFANQRGFEKRKLVDLASNHNAIGRPIDSEYLLYLFNAGHPHLNPDPLDLTPKDLKLSARLLREEIESTKNLESCPFLTEDND